VDMFGLNSNTYYTQILNASTYMLLIFLFIKDTENTEKKTITFSKTHEKCYLSTKSA